MSWEGIEFGHKYLVTSHLSCLKLPVWQPEGIPEPFAVMQQSHLTAVPLPGATEEAHSHECYLLVITLKKLGATFSEK